VNVEPDVFEAMTAALTEMQQTFLRTWLWSTESLL